MKRWLRLIALTVGIVTLASAVQITQVRPQPMDSGQCPRSLTVFGEFKLPTPASTAYQFVFSDGVRLGPIRPQLMNRGHHTVSIRRNFRHDFDGWVKLRVAQFPGGVRLSPPVRIQVRCTGGHGASHAFQPHSERAIRSISLSPAAPSRLRCPGTVTTAGMIRHGTDVEIRYRFVRNDGVRTPWQSVRFRRAGAFPVRHRWTVRRPVDARYRLVIRYRRFGGPWRMLRSTWSPFRVRCASSGGFLANGVQSVTLQAIPEHSTGPCPRPVRFRGTIRVNAPTTVRYRFIRSDGTRSPVHRFFAKVPGDYPIHTRWSITRMR
ncbi:hypothetical protein, partial [Nitratifractor sp.]